MIEFKAECGHTVRAKDENAGGVVRCSYCGREADVPDTKEDDLDFLFREVDQSDEGGGRKKRKRKGGKSLFHALARGRGGRPFDPFAVVLKLCYVAFLIAAVIFVGRTYLLPLLKSDGVADQIAELKKKTETPRQRQPRGGSDPKPQAGRGLIGREKIKGLYVMSTPPGASVHFMRADQLPPSGRLQQLPGADGIPSGRSSPIKRPGAGTYVVEVAFAMNNPKLKQFEGYRDFRRRVERGTPAERTRLVRRFFLPDEADRAFVQEEDGQFFIVRQYEGVTLQKNGVQDVRALFLPRATKGDKGAFAIEALVAQHIPPDAQYAFDRDNITDELSYYQVAPTDQHAVLEALSRIGVIPYYDVTEKSIRLFKIDIQDGSIRAPFIRETEP